MGDVDTDDGRKCLSVLVTVKPGESPGRGTYRKGVTRSTRRLLRPSKYGRGMKPGSGTSGNRGSLDNLSV